MAHYYDTTIKHRGNGTTYRVCVPVDAGAKTYCELLQAVMSHNRNAVNAGWENNTFEMIDNGFLRRCPKGAMKYEDFRGAVL